MSITSSDLLEFAGYLITMFSIGYCTGFLMRAFFRAMGSIR